MDAEKCQQVPQVEHLVTDPRLVGEYFLEFIESMEIAGQSDEGGPYSHLKSGLRERIVGQDEAVDSLIDVLNQEEFRDPARPIGTFMFLGPTGVGKSQTAKEISRLLHDGSDRAFLNINCAQFKSYGDVTVLQGAPPGYIGFNQPSILDEAIINQPRNVILFDEVEKAHPALHDFLMQILDEGEISIFNSGKKLSICNSIIILTSNAGSSEINDLLNNKPVGFQSAHQPGRVDIPEGKLTEVAFGALEKKFKPEFLGRIENKVLFRHLTDEQHALALEQYIKAVCTRDGYVKRGVYLDVSPALRDYVVESCPRRNIGGFREVKATFRKTIELEFQRRVLSGNIPENSLVYAVPASERTKQNNPAAIAEFRFKQFAA